MDQTTIKTTNPKCRHYWCLIEFIDWRYSQCWYFRPLLWTSAPLTFSLVHLTPPPRSITGVIHCVFDQIQDLHNCFSTPNKNLGGEGASYRYLPPSSFSGQIFKKSRHLGLESISYFVNGHTFINFPFFGAAIFPPSHFSIFARTHSTCVYLEISPPPRPTPSPPTPTPTPPPPHAGDFPTQEVTQMPLLNHPFQTSYLLLSSLIWEGGLHPRPCLPPHPHFVSCVSPLSTLQNINSFSNLQDPKVGGSFFPGGGGI